MIDPRSEVVLVRDDQGRFKDKTEEVTQHEYRDGLVHLTFRRAGGDGRTYRYQPERVAILHPGRPVPVTENSRVEISGDTWSNPTEAWRFEGPDGPWIRYFFERPKGPISMTSRESQTRLRRNAATAEGPAEVLGYWRRVVEALPSGDESRATRNGIERLTFIDEESALGRYLAGSPIERRESTFVPLFPFASNLSQRAAVATALSSPICVIDGPPGTGKTQTILNLVATLAAVPGTTVGVVSPNNAAVNNVYEKLTKEGFGYIAAGLGRRSRREEFVEDQPRRNAQVDALCASYAGPAPDWERLEHLADQLEQAQQKERHLKAVQHELDAHRLEQEHFERLLHGQDADDLDGLALAQRPSERIIDFIIESQLGRDARNPLERGINRFLRYVRYGPMRGVDATSSRTLLGLQRAYYRKRIAELEAQAQRLDRDLTGADLAAMVDEHQRLSAEALVSSLRARYTAIPRIIYDLRAIPRRFTQLSADYPVILSTCHSLGASIGDAELLDYLIIDEASQGDLLSTALALAHARNVVVVGDLKQLGHISDRHAADQAGPAPAPAYDYREHSILSSLIALYGDALPRTMLREHYRCDPTIIGFCNEKFYDGQLIPFTTSRPGARPMVVYQTDKGNHMRWSSGLGLSNQREVDVISNEVLPVCCAGVAPDDIGITTPYRRQVSKVTDSVIDAIEVDTVHKFQGREKKTVVMCTVVDETWRGRHALDFVDDPQLVNVAVSRAVEQFVLVTNFDMLPTSQNLRDLIAYIRYHDPAHDVILSQVVSVFDLLYQRYAERLVPLAGRLRGEMRYRSEDIIWTLLNEILEEDRYEGIRVVPQVLLCNLLSDLDQLDEEQASYVRHRASVDFVLYRGISKRPLLAIEVDGYAYHENRPDQLARDRLKDAICDTYGVRLLRLCTTGSGEEARIRTELDRALADTTL